MFNENSTFAFHIPIDKDVVRRILAHHYRPRQDSNGPSWLTFRGHLKDSLWSTDLFRASRQRCGSTGSWWSWIIWVRRPCGNGRRCRTLSAVQPRHSTAPLVPKCLSSDNDPLYRSNVEESNEWQFPLNGILIVLCVSTSKLVLETFRIPDNIVWSAG